MLPIPFYEFLTQAMGYFYLFFQYICHALMLPLNAHLDVSYFKNPFLNREFMYGFILDDITSGTPIGHAIGVIVESINDVAMAIFDGFFNLFDFGVTTSSPTWQCLLFLMGFVIVIFIIIKMVKFVFSN